jgi:hypothetical protein
MTARQLSRLRAAMAKNAMADVIADDTIAELLADAVLTPAQVVESVEVAFERIFAEPSSSPPPTPACQQAQP